MKRYKKRGEVSKTGGQRLERMRRGREKI